MNINNVNLSAVNYSSEFSQQCLSVPLGYDNFTDYCSSQHFIVVGNNNIHGLLLLLFAIISMGIGYYIISKHEQILHNFNILDKTFELLILGKYLLYYAPMYMIFTYVYYMVFLSYTPIVTDSYQKYGSLIILIFMAVYDHLIIIKELIDHKKNTTPSDIIPIEEVK